MKLTSCALLFYLALGGQGGDWESVELEVPKRGGGMAPRFSQDSTWLSWIEAGSESAWVLVAADLSAETETERVVFKTAERDEIFVNWADRPVFSTDSSRSWLAAWLPRNGESAYAYDSVCSVSVDEGKLWSAPEKLHSDEVQGEHGFISLLPRSEGGWAACWLDGRAMGGGHDDHGHASGPMQLRLAHIDYEGKVSAERVLDERVCECCPTALCALPGGGAVLVYRDRGEGEMRDFAYTYSTDAGLDRWSSPRAVHEDGWRVDGCPVNGAALASDGEEVAVVWYTMGADSTPRVRCAWWDAEREAFGAPKTIAEGKALGRIAAAMLPSGELAVTWLEALEEPGSAEWRLAVGSRSAKSFHIQSLISSSASRASGISTLAVDGEELLFACTRTEPSAAVIALRLFR